MRSVITVISAILLTAVATCSHAQGQPPAKAPAPKPAAARPTSTAASKPAAKPAANPAAKPVVKKHAATNSTEGAAGSSTAEQARIARRDPFESLLSRQKAGTDAKNLPPGKGGLQVSTLKIDGIVHGPNGMIAVVSNPQQRTYFLHEGDQLYDGRVDKIAMDGVSFHETGKDAFGKPVERSVNKRIYSTAGEEQ
jgi:pyruvate/2-oxoglutarate dehydrogenase complex dihydrolipoamide acyltransferase (E2) component